MARIYFTGGKVLLNGSRVAASESCCCDGDGDEDRDECTLDRDCPEGQVCVNGKCRTPCNDNEDCPEGQVCVDGVCRDACTGDEDCPQGEVCVDGVCRDGCQGDGDCPPGQICVDGACRNPCECDTAYGNFGWFTEQGLEDIVDLLTLAGYVCITITAESPFPGVPAPYFDGCGQTLVSISAKCCGTKVGCVPATVSANIRAIAGPGNQFPPCGAAINELNTVDSCCNPFP